VIDLVKEIEFEIDPEFVWVTVSELVMETVSDGVGTTVCETVTVSEIELLGELVGEGDLDLDRVFDRDLVLERVRDMLRVLVGFGPSEPRIELVLDRVRGEF